MGLDRVHAGDKHKLPHAFNVIIEIPMHAEPVKYEVDKESGAIFVDRFMLTAMRYPCNYGYIPHTLSADGDPVDVLVMTPFALQTGVVVTCRALGMLEMEDESGNDAKLLAVPITKLYPPYAALHNYNNLGVEELRRIQHFFEHYKDLESGKWVKVKGWQGIEAAHAEINRGLESYKQS